MADGGGLLEPGNIDMNTRPRVRNRDGSISTVRTMGFDENGQFINVPTVSDDGRIMSYDEAVDQYHRTGRHLGKFSSQAAADRAAQALHESEARKLDNPMDITKDPEFRAIVKAGGPDMNGKLQALFAARAAASAAPVPFTEDAAPAAGGAASKQAVFTVADGQGAKEAPPVPPKLDPLEQSIVSEDLRLKPPQLIASAVQRTPAPAEQRSGGLFPGVTNPPAPAGADYARAGGLFPGVTGEAAPAPQAPPGQAGAVIPAPGAQGTATQGTPEAGPPPMSPLEQEMAGIDAAARLSQRGAGGPGGSSSAAMALRDSNANLDAAVKNLQAEVLRKGTAGYAEGATQAYQQAAYADGLKQQSDVALRERQGLMDEVQRRGRLVDEASQQFTTAMRGAPLGSALNPDAAMRVTGAIGLALGGALQGFRGGPNPALAIINTAIERDLQERRLAIEAGRARMDATNQAYRTSYEVLGSWNAATEQMRANLLGQANLTRESISAQGLGEEKLANSKILGAELDVKMKEADQAAKALAFRQLQAAGRPQDPLKRLMQVEELKLKVAQRAKLMGEVEGVGSPKGIEVDRMYKRLKDAMVVEFNDAERTLQPALKQGDLPGRVLRAMNRVADDNSRPGVGFIGMSKEAFATAVSSAFPESERVAANRIVNSLNLLIQAGSGKQINENEGMRYARAHGMGANASEGELRAGIEDISRYMRVKRDVIRKTNPSIYDALMAGSEPGPADGFDPTQAPAHGR